VDVNRGLGGFSLGGIHPAGRLAGSLSGVDTCDGGRCGVESSRVLVIGAYSAHLARPQHTNVADSPPAQRGNETVVGKAVIAIDLVGVASASRTGVHGSGDLVLGKVVAVKVQDHLPGGHGTKHVGLLSIEAKHSWGVQRGAYWMMRDEIKGIMARSISGTITPWRPNSGSSRSIRQIRKIAPGRSGRGEPAVQGSACSGPGIELRWATGPQAAYSQQSVFHSSLTVDRLRRSFVVTVGLGYHGFLR